MNRRSPPTCRRVRAALQAWADGQPLPEGLQGHLDHCPSCRGFREFLISYPHALKAGLDASMRGWPPADLQALLSAQPARPIAPGSAEGARGRRRRRWWVPAAAAAAALMVAGWGAYRLYDSQRIARAVRTGLSAAVDRLYDVPLAGGVEGALVHPEPDEGQVLEGMSPETGLEDLGAGWFAD